MNTTTPPQSRVSKITVGRLHNLGNYEHIRYEITVDVPEGASASQTISNIGRVLDGLDPKPPVASYDLQRARESLKIAEEKGEEGLEEWERNNLTAYRNYIAKDAAWRAEQKLAREALDDIGGNSVYTDAKDDWVEDW